MSYRATILSSLPTYGLGTLPGGNILTNISSSYSSRKGSSASRKYGETSLGDGSSGRPGSSPLPVGPGPLDHAGKKHRDSTGRTSSIQRDIDNEQQENENGVSKSLSRQSSSSSKMTVKVWNKDKTVGKLVNINSFEDLVIRAKDKLLINPNVDIKVLLEDGCEVDDTDCLVALVTTAVKPPLSLFIIKPSECLCLPLSSSEECCICLDRPKESFLIPCGHSYCTECAVQIESTTKSCPQCRCEINKIGKLRD